MNFRLKITDEAAQQLRSIAHYYAEASQSEDIAFKWYAGFIDALESLKQNPLRCTVAPESNLFDFEIRELLYGSGKRLTHRAIFRIIDQTIEVLAIRHHAQRPLIPGDL